MLNLPTSRPYTTVILAMTADGKISDVSRSGVTFGSSVDYKHLEERVAGADGVLMGGTTLRSGETAMRVQAAEWLTARREAGKPPQPVQIVCSASGEIDPDLPFFRQPIPRWLLTTPRGAEFWQTHSGFEQVLTGGTSTDGVDFSMAFGELRGLGIERLAVLGGGTLIASLFDLGLVDELWLTVCAYIFGGSQAPTPVDGLGFARDRAPRLRLLDVERVEDEVFLHYQVRRSPPENLATS
ncbi:MAG: riboflavin deaminase [Phormidium sp. GEM2.Bin31]|nr:dihydrofolate reductase family protein [Phormidium sp. BM_Day4_Bin.17]TVR12440.1 MAG: riboflavin deaminase [Phormidium sp. GEM2.Bin31]UCJ12078.1 MAG: dihydrofolate reductase family protein [Phormidium sp. PBR-2020]